MNDEPPLQGFVPVPAERARRYRRAGHWNGQGLAELVLAPARAAGARRCAVVDAAERLTYGELDERSRRLAVRLRAAGLRRRDRVVVQLPNGAPFVTLVLALWRLAAIPVMALPGHRERELRHLVRQAGAAGLAVPARQQRADHLAVARRLRAEQGGPGVLVVLGQRLDLRPGEVDLAAAIAGRGENGDVGPGGAGDDVALLLLSGGTTALPKLIPRTHDDYGYNVRLSAELCRLDDDAVYHAALPVGHNFPLGCPGVLGTLARGGRVVFGTAAAPGAGLALMDTERVTVTAAVPTLAQQWSEVAEATGLRPRALELLQVGGARLAPEAARRLRRLFDCRVQQVYGMAEGLLNFTRLDDPDDVVDATQGRPASPDDEVRVVDDGGADVPDGDVGELWTRGPYTIAGYFRSPEHNAVAFTADGFYRTGDLVSRCPCGNLTVEGRIKDMINRAGEKIAAAELEDLLLGHPAVADAAAVAMPDSLTGEAVCLFLVFRRGAALTLHEARAYLDAAGLARYKLPDRVVPMDALPLTAVGKVDKAHLRRLLDAPPA